MAYRRRACIDVWLDRKCSLFAPDGGFGIRAGDSESSCFGKNLPWGRVFTLHRTSHI